MAVTACYELSAGPRGGQDFSNQRGSVSAREYTRTFFVKTDSRSDGQVTVLFAPGLPLLGTTYSTASGEFDDGAVAVRRTPRQLEESPTCWHVEVDYTTDWERIDQPLFDPPQIDWSTESFQEDAIGEANQEYDPSDPSGQPWKLAMVNSAGDYIEGITREASRRIITVTRNESVWDDANATFFRNTINAESWNGFPFWTVMCRAIDVIGQWHKNVNGQPDFLYFQVKYTFAIKSDRWVARPVDRGPRYYDANGKKKQFLTEDGNNYVDLLDMHGKRLLPPNATQSDRTGITPFYHSKLIYRAVDFTPFNINLNVPLANQKLRRT